MFILNVKNPDGTTYIKETFEDKVSLDKWLDTEQKRPYWNKEFLTEIIDKTKESQDEEVRQEAEKLARSERISAMKILGDEINILAAKKRSADETEELVNKIVQYLGLGPVANKTKK